MRTPKQLTGSGAEFWKKNAPHLELDGLLCEATSDAFLMLCQLWGKLQDTPDLDPIKAVALSKQCQNLMRQFGMDPTARRKLVEPKDDAEPDRWGL